MAELDLSARRAIHVLGLGGSGMSAIATVLARMGHRVSGSDLKDSTALDRLRLLGVEAHVGHRAEHVPEGADAVVRSTAVADTNPEVVAAVERGIPVLRRAEALRAISRVRRTVAVSGTHGKTTTSSMLALVLREAGWSPSFIIGGEVNEVGGNAAWDDGEWLVVEADESDGTFVEVAAEAAVVTNVEPDHLEHYGGFEPLVEAFRRFVEVSGPVVLCADDPIAAELAPGHPRAVTYGFDAGASYRITGWSAHRGGTRFELEHRDTTLGALELPVPGRHNASNAAAAAVTALELGVAFEAVRVALGRFAGVSRRFQFRGEVGGVTVVDDYAHLPGEVRAVIRAARDGGWDRVVACFQPHRYSRTESLWGDFGDAFDDADVVVLTDVYPAGEAPRPGVSGRLLLQAVLDRRPDARVIYLPRRSDVERFALRATRPGDLVMTLGAGDITAVADAWLHGAT